MGVFDYAKAKVAQGTGEVANLNNKHIGQAETGAACCRTGVCIEPLADHTDRRRVHAADERR